MQRVVSACTLAVLVVAMTVSPAAAAAGPSTGPAAPGTTDSAVQSDSQFNGTAFLAVDKANDGDVVAGGVSGIVPGERAAGPNGTIVRVGAEGAVDWTTRLAGANVTRVVDVLAADNGVYFLAFERTPELSGPEAAEVRLGKVSGGDIAWQQPLNGTVGYAAGGGLVDTDDGVALASYRPDGAVQLTEYSGRTVAWKRSYDVDARVTSVRTTDDGFLLAGSVGSGDPWVLRTSDSGQPVFNETYPGIAAATVLGAVPTEDDGTLLAGRSRGSFSGGSSAWTARLDGDGGVHWTRVHGTGSDLRVSRVLAASGGAVLLVQQSAGLGEDDPAKLLGIGPDGAELFDKTVEDAPRVTAAARSGDTLQLAGLTNVDPLAQSYTGVLTEVPVPDAGDGGGATLDAEADLASNGTFYRGQNVRVTAPGPTDRYDLLRLPGERDRAAPRAVRQVSFGADDTAVVESATLPRGKYVLRAPYGRTVTVEDGRVSGFADRSEAAFRLDSQRFFRVGTNRTFVDVAAGERSVALTLDSDRSEYDVHVRADRFRGDAAGAAALREAFDHVDGFEGIDVVDGQPAARIEVGDEERVRLNATVGALGPGLYDVVVSGVDTRDGGAVADGRVVVGTTAERPVGLELGNRSLSAAAGEEAATNVTLTGLTAGVGALSLSANRTGEPNVALRLRADVNATRTSAGASVSRNATETETTALDADTPSGTVEVARLRVDADGFGRDPVTNGTNTATLRVDWVVDGDGLPYTLPDPVMVTYEVTGAGNATAADDGAGGAAAGNTATAGEGGDAGGPY